MSFEPVITLVRWECIVCKAENPVDHEGIFCSRCKRMACCSCELRMREHECVEVDWGDDLPADDPLGLLDDDYPEVDDGC